MKRDERGASAVEYGLLIALTVAVFIFAAWAFGAVIGDVLEHHACKEEAGYDCTNE